MEQLQTLINFTEKHGYGFSVSRASGTTRFTVFIHTTIKDMLDNGISVYSQSMFLDDAIGMTIEKAKLKQPSHDSN